jgi:hypothetical protein
MNTFKFPTPNFEFNILSKLTLLTTFCIVRPQLCNCVLQTQTQDEDRT